MNFSHYATVDLQVRLRVQIVTYEIDWQGGAPLPFPLPLS